MYTYTYQNTVGDTRIAELESFNFSFPFVLVVVVSQAVYMFKLLCKNHNLSLTSTVLTDD